MRANLGRGKSARGLIRYLLLEKGKDLPRPGATIGGGNMSAALQAVWTRDVERLPEWGINEDDIARETLKLIDDLCRDFGRSRALRPETARPIWHCSLSLPKDERLPDDVWDQIVIRLLEKIGLDPDLHAYIWVRHMDTPYEHVHIQSLRIGQDGSLWGGAKDAEAVQKACRELELEFGLRVTYQKETRRQPSARERRVAEQTGLVPARTIIQEEIDALMQDADGSIALFDFIRRLAGRGIDVKLNQSPSTGRVAGISFGVDGEYFAGRKLGRSYSWPSLEKAGVFVSPAADVASLNGEVEQRLVAGVSTIEPGYHERQIYKGVLLSRHYERDVLPERIIAALHQVNLKTVIPTIILKDRSRVSDLGARITTNRATEISVALMFEMVEAKGWPSVKIHGDDPEFIRMAIEEAERRGIVIDNLMEIAPQRLMNGSQRVFAEFIDDHDSNNGEGNELDPGLDDSLDDPEDDQDYGPK